MPEQNEHIDELIRQKLEGFEMIPPSGVWTKTKAEIAPGKWGRRFWIYFIAGSILLVVLGYRYSVSLESTDHLNFSKRAEKVQDNLSLSQNSIIENDHRRVELTNTKKETSNRLENESKERANFSMNGDPVNETKDFNAIGLLTEGQVIGGSKVINTNALFAVVHTSENDNEPESIDPEESDQISLEQLQSNTIVGALPKKSLKNNLFGSSNVFSGKSLPLLNDRNGFHRFSLEIALGYSTFTTYRIKSSLSSSFESVLKKSATDRSSLDLDVGVNFKLNRQFSLFTGIHLSKLSETIQYLDSSVISFTYIDTTGFFLDTVTMDTVYITNTIVVDSTVISSEQSSNAYRLFSIPFGVSFNQRISAKSELEFKLGGEFMIYGKHSGRLISDENNNTILASDGLKTSGVISLYAGIRYIYRFHPKHSIYIEPWVNRGISVFNTSMLNYKIRLFQGGLRLGYRINL